MITYNGIELDYRADTLQSLIIKGGLTKIDNLTDRTGTSSTQFNLPRTAKNELAFGNITTEGSELTTSGSAFITLEGNVFSQGVLYVRGYDKDNFKCLFMGSDLSLIAQLKNLPLRDLFPITTQNSFTDSNVLSAIPSENPKTLGQDITFHYGHPYIFKLSGTSGLSTKKVAPFFNIRHMVYKIFMDRGYNFVSNFFDSDYGTAMDYSSFTNHKSSNTFTNTNDQFPISGSATSIFLDLGTGLAGNNSITESAYGGTGKKYAFQDAITQLKITGNFKLQNFQLNFVAIDVVIYDNLNNLLYTSNTLLSNVGRLQNGNNPFDFNLDLDIPANGYVVFQARFNSDTTISFPLQNQFLQVTNMTISHDNIKSSDAVYFGDYMGKLSQLDFISGLLKQFNLVMDVDTDNVYIELQDKGVEPVGTSPATLPSITSEQYDLTNIVQDNAKTDIEYLQAGLILLKQKLLNTDYPDTLSYLPYQEYGSSYYELEGFDKRNVQESDSYFNCMLDGETFLSSTVRGGVVETWDNYISMRILTNGTYDGTRSVVIENSFTGGTTTLNALINWSEPVTYATTLNKLFINTLNQKKNNKIIEVIFRDELGTIVNNRTEYIFNNQVYKIVEWNYDIIKKLVKAKLIMK